MVKHIVIFKFQGSLEERLALAEQFRNALVVLPDKISVLQSMEVGINENPVETWDLVLTAIVPDMPSVTTYATDPAHVAAAAIVKGKVESRACVDYYC